MITSIFGAWPWQKQREDIVCAFPKEKTIIKALTLPTARPEEMLDMVKLQAARHIPLESKDMVVDYQWLEDAPDGFSKIRMVVARLEDVQDTLASYSKKGLLPDRLEPEPGINLLPEKIRLQKSRAFLRQQQLGTGILFLLCTGLLSLGFAVKIQAQKMLLAQLTRASAHVSPHLQDLRRMESRISAMTNRLNDAASLLHVLAELNQTVPAGASIQSISFERGRPLLVEGHCRTLSDAVRVVEALQRSPLFLSVEMRSSHMERSQDQDIAAFSLSCRWRGSHA